MTAESPKLTLIRGKTADSGAARVESLFAEHRTALLRYLTRVLANREDAEEVVQDTYLRLLAVPRMGGMYGDAARRYVFKVGLNLARDRFRQGKSRHRQAHVPVEPGQLVSDADSPDEILDWNTGMEVIKQVLLDLPPRYRRVFLLHVVQNMSYRNIARHLAVSTKTVERDIAMVLELCQGRLRVEAQR